MTDRAARRRLAKGLMDTIAVGCVTLALAIATSQLVKEGLQEFLFRPPGVGASPSQADNSAGPAASPSTPPQVAELIPPAAVPSPPPVEEGKRHHDGSHHR